MHWPHRAHATGNKLGERSRVRIASRFPIGQAFPLSPTVYHTKACTLVNTPRLGILVRKSWHVYADNF
jgi:hypothetical protein